MLLEHSTAGELDSVDWEGVQGIVREFRRALDRGERPALEAYLPEHGTQRKDALIELVHEEMEFRIKAGESSVLGSYLQRFPEIVDDPRALSDLVIAELDLQRRVAGKAREEPAVAAEKAACPSRLPACIGRYELGEVIGQGAFGVVFRAWDTTLKRVVALKRPRPGTLDARGAVERFLRKAQRGDLAPSPHRHRARRRPIRRRAIPGQHPGRGPEPRRRARHPTSWIRPGRRMGRRAGRGARTCRMEWG